MRARFLAAACGPIGDVYIRGIEAPMRGDRAGVTAMPPSADGVAQVIFDEGGLAYDPRRL